MISIKLTITDIEFTPGKQLVKMYPQFADDFAKYIAELMKQELVKAIEKQRYSSKWAPLSFSYMRYKKLHGLSLNVWEAHGILKDSIIARKQNGHYVIGIDETKRYKNGPKVAQVAKWMEYGTSTMPARPLFRPVITYIRKNMGRYWRKFLKDKGTII
jgi:hypothetical protein